MKTFQEFLEEDFKSEDAVVFELPSKVLAATSWGKNPAKVFYEKLPLRPFNLVKYYYSFRNKGANDLLELRIANNIRGLIVATATEYLSFVFDGKILHANFVKMLDMSKTELNLPSIRFEKIYNNTYLFDEGDKINTPWCLPIAITPRGEFILNSSRLNITGLMNQQNLESRFMLTREMIDKMLEPS